MKHILLYSLLAFSFQTHAEDLDVLDHSQLRPEDITQPPFPLQNASITESGVGTHALLPLANYILPGVGELYHGQYEQALWFSGLFLGGSVFADSSGITDEDIEELSRISEETGINPFVDPSNELKVYLAGIKLQGTVASFAAYNTFRTAIRNNPKDGAFSFLTHEESLLDLLKAPLRYEFLSRSSTWIPLSIIGSAFLLSGPKSPDVQDILYTGSISLMAGAGEEALFRGWLMPLAHHYTGNHFASNVLQASLFWAAHTPNSPVHMIAGLWFGHLTQKNSWTLSEAVFLHTWWDVFALGSALIHNARHPEEAVALRIDLPTISLP